MIIELLFAILVAICVGLCIFMFADACKEIKALIIMFTKKP